MVASFTNHGHTSFASTRARGAATQTRILERAVHIASIEGLESMSLATLAKATSMSKSGLFAHFRSKEALQISIIDEAERMFFETVVRPAQAQKVGIDRVRALVDAYVDYFTGGLFEGGCFFAAAAHEFDGRPGPVRDRVVAFFDNWSQQLKTALTEAQQRGDLKNVDTDAFVFELNGIGMAANLVAQLHGGSEKALKEARAAAASLIARATTEN